MRRVILIGLAAVAAMVAWAALVGFGMLEGWGRAAIAPRGDPAAFMRAVRSEIDAKSVGNFAFVLVEDGRVFDEHYTSAGAPVDRDTLFAVGSLSKWISAWGVLTLVEEGVLELDAPVSAYLTRWALPPSEFDNDGVTVRRLLSHMAGLTDGLGYAGFAAGEPVQSLEESLTRAADASPGADGRVRVGLAPGTEWRYSGGGYVLLQLLVEEVTGESFDAYLQRAVFAPLGMTRSTYDLDRAAARGLAESFATDGTSVPHRRFTALAPTSLFTSAGDMVRFVQAHVPGPSGEPAGRGVLAPATLEEMRRSHARSFGTDIWGLGAMLFAPNQSGDFIVGHGGDDEPAINTAVALDPDSGDGAIALQSGNELFGIRLTGEWIFWRTGRLDFLNSLIEFRARTGRFALLIGAGWIAILAGAVLLGRRSGTARA